MSTFGTTTKLTVSTWPTGLDPVHRLTVHIGSAEFMLTAEDTPEGPVLFVSTIDGARLSVLPVVTNKVGLIREGD